MAYQIRLVREKRRMTQEELAKKAGISRATISTLENNPAAITTTDTLKKVAHALSVSVNDIFLD